MRCHSSSLRWPYKSSKKSKWLHLKEKLAKSQKNYSRTWWVFKTSSWRSSTPVGPIYLTLRAQPRPVLTPRSAQAKPYKSMLTCWRSWTTWARCTKFCRPIWRQDSLKSSLKRRFAHLSSRLKTSSQASTLTLSSPRQEHVWIWLRSIESFLV